MQLVEYTKSIHNRPEDFSLFSPKFLINPTMALQVFCRALRQRYLQPLFITSRVNYSQPSEHDPIDLENPYTQEKKQCILCRLKITASYKNPRLLSQFQSSYTGKIYGRNITGLCRPKHTEVEKAIYKSQACGFMPVYHKAAEFLDDHRLYNPEKPTRHHPF